MTPLAEPPVTDDLSAQRILLDLKAGFRKLNPAYSTRALGGSIIKAGCSMPRLPYIARRFNKRSN